MKRRTRGAGARRKGSPHPSAGIEGARQRAEAQSVFVDGDSPAGIISGVDLGALSRRPVRGEPVASRAPGRDVGPSPPGDLGGLGAPDPPLGAAVAAEVLLVDVSAFAAVVHAADGKELAEAGAPFALAGESRHRPGDTQVPCPFSSPKIFLIAKKGWTRRGP